MKRKAFATAALLIPLSSQACEHLVSVAADRLLAPVVFHLVASYLNQLEDRSVEESSHTTQVERYVERILVTAGPGADEAIAALSRIYLGEWYGPVRYCAMTKRKPRVLLALRVFEKCVPKGRAWVVLDQIRLASHYASQDLRDLRSGMKCPLE